MMTVENELERLERHRGHLENALKVIIDDIGDIPVGTIKHFPMGWRKAGKGRTVWRLLEEIISQNLEVRHKQLGFANFESCESEVGVYDFRFSLDGVFAAYVNIKSSVSGARANKDDISKARLLEDLYSAECDCALMVAAVEIEFKQNMTLKLGNATVVPVSWIPDIYVNPSNNGNLQSSKYKDVANMVRRTNNEFLSLLRAEMKVADSKRQKQV
jgi:hypothetical protein